MPVPILYIASGNEKEISEKLKNLALSSLGIPMSSLEYTEKGKPFIKNSDIGISITHDSDTVALLLAPFSPVGIDMQIISDEYPIRVPDRFFTKNERLLISSPSDFYNIWCKKESFVKMTGEGISGMSSFDSTKSDLIFTDLSDEMSKITGKSFCFFICSKEKIYPDIKVI